MLELDMAYGGFKNLTRRATSDKILRDKAFNIVKNPKYDGYQRDIALLVYDFFDKKTAGGAVKNEIMQDKELAKELHKPIIRKFKKRKIYSSLIYNMWEADLADMQFISIFNKGFRFYYALLIFSKIPMKDKKNPVQLLMFFKNF